MKHSGIEFWINAGSGGSQRLNFNMIVYNNSNANKVGPNLSVQSYLEGGALKANTWVRGFVNLTNFPVTTYDGIFFIDQSGGTSQPMMYLDDITIYVKPTQTTTTSSSTSSSTSSNSVSSTSTTSSNTATSTSTSSNSKSTTSTSSSTTGTDGTTTTDISITSTVSSSTTASDNSTTTEGGGAPIDTTTSEEASLGTTLTLCNQFLFVCISLSLMMLQ